jgi:16S rRNA (guanine966-N2)-methyltransferase
MKDRLRQALFNILGPLVEGKHALDLFAGTGALALEAVSRGAERATLIERDGPTARVVRQNIASLGAESQCSVLSADVFRWWQRRPDLGAAAWLIFCSPPYAFYVDRQAEMLELIRTMLDAAPEDSVLVVESDERFDFSLLPDSDAWDVRRYPPALIGIYVKGE